MFASVCTACGRRELVFSDQIRSLQPTADGFDVRYTCTCGSTQIWHVSRPEAAPTSAAAA